MTSTPDPVIAIRRNLELAPLAKAFAAAGRVQIPDFLTPSASEALHQALARRTPWVKSLLVEGRNVSASPEQLRRMPPDDLRRLNAMRASEARGGFQFAFDTWPVSDHVEAGGRSGHPAESFYDLINAPPFFDIIARLTGNDRGVYCDAQCTRYGPGDFLNTHSDNAEGKHRLFAYVMSLTPEWRTDWGGLLMFTDSEGEVEEVYRPAFNTLNIFAVPHPHLVTMVAPFAGAARLSITGWIRARRP